MPTLLSDPSTTFYAFLGIMAIVLVGLWLRSRKRGDLIRALLGVALLGAAISIDQFVESPREEATRKIGEMCKSTQDKKWDDVFKHVSDSFRYKEVDKKTFREKAKSIEGLPEFKGVTVWDFARADFKQIDDKNLQLGFRAQLRDLPISQSYILATFAKEADGQWRMSGFKRYDPAKQTLGEQLPVPGLE